jgi:diketogulonate reductase-like aldo/keto reductase
MDPEAAAIRYALDLGQNHIDTAEDYADGGAERVVGTAIEGLHRANLFVASKLWKQHVASGTVRGAVEAMLRRLQTDYLDLLYIHHPWHAPPWQEAIPQIDDLIDEGVVRYLGVSNFDADRLREASALSRHAVMADQVLYNCRHRRDVTDALRRLCAENGTTIVAYRPLAQGELVGSGAIVAIARRSDATPAQVALAWLLARGALPIPKALGRDHIEQNAAVIDLRLSADDVALIDRSF